MDNLQNTHSKSKLELSNPFSILHYLTDVEVRLLEEELHAHQEEFCFTKRYRSAYTHRGGSKGGNTELRITGVILNKIEAMLSRTNKGGKPECRVTFTKADIARQVQDEAGEGISTRTVQRYLQTVLTKMADIYGIHFKTVDGRYGHIAVWTSALQEIEESGQRELDLSIALKTRAPKLRQVLVLASKQRETKTATLNYSMAKGVNLIRGRMIKLAFVMVRQRELPFLKNLEISNWDVVNLLVARLIKGEWRESAWKAVMSALVTTDRAMSEYSLFNPVGYCRNELNKIELHRASREDLRKERLRYAQEGLKMAQMSADFWRETEPTGDLEMEIKKDAEKRLEKLTEKVAHLRVA